MPQDLACQASGSLWCDALEGDGDLVQAGSATAVDSELRFDSGADRFEIRPLTPPGAGKIRILFSGHNLFAERKPSSRKTIFTKQFEDCYFYPRGNGPAQTDRVSRPIRSKRKSYRPNENRLRVKLIRVQSPFQKDRVNKADDEWSWAVVQHHPDIRPVPLVSLTDTELSELLESGVEIKQYGWSSGTLDVAVTSDNTKIYTHRGRYLQRRSRHVLLDCNDTSGGASGGATTISLNSTSGRRIEAVLAVRVGWTTSRRKNADISPGIRCNPRVNANYSLMVRGAFYRSIIDDAERAWTQPPNWL